MVILLLWQKMITLLLCQKIITLLLWQTKDDHLVGVARQRLPHLPLGHLQLELRLQIVLLTIARVKERCDYC